MNKKTILMLIVGLALIIASFFYLLLTIISSRGYISELNAPSYFIALRLLIVGGKHTCKDHPCHKRKIRYKAT